MKPSTIDKFLEECGIHTGPYSTEVIDFDDVRINAKSEFMNGICSIGECYSPENGAIFAASREMLKALIFSGIIMEYEKTATDFPLEETFSGKIIIDSIQKALPGKTWTEIKKRLEELDAV